MTPENLLLYLCLNLLTHRAARLQPLTDLIAFLAKESAALDWPLVVKLVQSLEWPHGAFWALRCAEELQSGLVPPAALRALKPDRFSAGWIESFFGPGAEYVIRSGSRLTGPRGTLALVGCEKGFTGRARLLAAMLFPPAATLRQMEPGQQDQSTIVHYFARIARAAGQLLPSGNRNSG